MVIFHSDVSLPEGTSSWYPPLIQPGGHAAGCWSRDTVAALPSHAAGTGLGRWRWSRVVIDGEPSKNKTWHRGLRWFKTTFKNIFPDLACKHMKSTLAKRRCSLKALDYWANMAMATMGQHQTHSKWDRIGMITSPTSPIRYRTDLSIIPTLDVGPRSLSVQKVYHHRRDTMSGLTSHLDTRCTVRFWSWGDTAGGSTGSTPWCGRKAPKSGFVRWQLNWGSSGHWVSRNSMEQLAREEILHGKTNRQVLSAVWAFCQEK